MSSGRPDVLLVSTHWNPTEAAYRRLLYFVQYLVSRGLAVSCAGFTQISRARRMILKPDKQCYNISLFISSRPTIITTLLNIILSFPLILYLIIVRPRVVLISIPDSHPVIFAQIGAKIIGAKVIIDVRDSQEEILISSAKGKWSRFIANIYKTIIYKIYKKSDIIIAVTHSLVKILSIKLNRLVVLVPNGADLQLFKPLNKVEARKRLGLNEHSFLIAFIGGLFSEGYYNVLPLLFIIKKIRKKHDLNVELIIAGHIDSIMESILKNFKDECLYFGVLATENVITLLSSSDIGVIPRVKDPVYNYALPVKFYEYIATGLPVIALVNKESELAKIVEENKLGLVCEPNDVTCLERTIISLATDRYLLERLRRNVFAFRKYVDRAVGAEVLYRLIKIMINKE